MITENGKLGSITYNKWDDSDLNDVFYNNIYSLLQHAETLIIKNNQRAVRELLQYIALGMNVNMTSRRIVCEKVKIIIENPGDTTYLLPVIINQCKNVTIDG